jgi:solute carrier family 8 (sodium/calcium exchanger)
MAQPKLVFRSTAFAVSEGQVAKIVVDRHGDASKKCSVKYHTRDGSARKGEDYMEAHGELVFEPGISELTFDVFSKEDHATEDTEEFYVDLDEPVDATLGEDNQTKVVIIDKNKAGTLSFEKEKIEVLESCETTELTVTVYRCHGSHGTIQCKYATEDGSAKEGSDYVGVQDGVLEFAEGVVSATFPLTIMPKGRYEGTEQFRVRLTEPTNGADFEKSTDGGLESCILRVIILADPCTKNAMDSLMRKVNWDSVSMGHANWKEQFVSAVYVGGDSDAQKEATKLDWVMHLISLPWKLFFALVPPTDFAGGWVCFFTALIFIGFVTALIGDMANLLGCAMDLKAELCAITFVALGTSLPDTFASKTAATQDPTADNSIGNVTGSNSVNVYLGLGLPWMLGAIYWKMTGASPEWKHRGMDKGWGDPASSVYLPHVIDYDGAFVVPTTTGSFGVSGGVFSAFAVITIGLLMFRRNSELCGKAELGGPKKMCYATSAFLVALWLIYIGVSFYVAWPISPY